MAKDTKERILETALQMFSQNGYAGTNVRELTAALGLVKSSMYRHFESKEAIWNTLLDQMIAYYDERFGSTAHLPPVPDSLEGLVQMTMGMVNFTVHDEKIVMTRKVLTIEQFRDERARGLATKHFLTGLTDMFTHVFAGMMDKGLLRRDDPAMLAVCIGFGLLGLVQWIRRRSIARVDRDILLLGGYYILVILGYLVFEMIPINYRPILIDGAMEASYPSSTTLLVLSVMPTLLFQVDRRAKRQTVRRMTAAFVALFSAFMVIGRLVAGVHWLTDIVGSVLLSGGLYLLYRSTVIFMEGR